MNSTYANYAILQNKLRRYLLRKKNLYFGKTESWCYRVGTFLFFIVYLISPKTRFLSKKPVYD